MILLHDIEELRIRVASLRKRHVRVGLVPTMGALHEGHLSLVRRSLRECAATIVSIFVNPTQFGEGEDFDRYPRNLETDMTLLKTVEHPNRPTETTNREPLLVFAPSVRAMYPDGFSTTIDVDAKGGGSGISTILEGAIRPGHFRGVATVVAKLLLLSHADAAFFGQKDLQQFAVIQKMGRELNIPTELYCCPIVREDDGLAMSSRNRYLSAAHRKAAVCLFQSLEQAKKFITDSMITSPAAQLAVEDVRKIIRTRVAAEPEAVLDYVAVVATDTFEELSVISWPHPSTSTPPTYAGGSPCFHSLTLRAPSAISSIAILIAVRFGTTRLIDNVVIPTVG